MLLLCFLALGTAAQGDISAAAAGATAPGASSWSAASKCGPPAALSLCMLARGQKCERVRGILQPQLENDVRAMASRQGVVIRKADLTVGVQLLSSKVTAAAALDGSCSRCCLRAAGLLE
jgi:hypothetical protein